MNPLGQTHACALEVQALRVRLDADAHEYTVRFHAHVFVARGRYVDGHAMLRPLDPRYRRADEERYPLLAQRPGQRCGDLRVLLGQRSVRRLDDCHFRAVRRVHVRELNPDRTGPDDYRMGWRRVLHDRLAVRHHRVPVDLDRREETGARAGGDDD